MSSSASRALAQPEATQTTPTALPVLPFRYREVARDLAGEQDSSVQQEFSGQRFFAGQAAEGEAQARELGRQQGEREARTKFEEQLARERAAIDKALEDFARQRAAFFRKVEQEAVQLALSIARKVLYREAQADPLLLMGVVRVAMERIEGATEISLAVHPQKVEEWRRYLAAQLAAGQSPEIIADPAMPRDRCELRTSMGTALLGVEVQLKEIEQGLMDLMAARPQEKS
jgi:flagellar assembly protein FliH